MKIAIIIEHFDATRGGAEAYAVWLSAKLGLAGHDVHVVCQDALPCDKNHHAAGPEAAPKGVHIHALKGMHLNTGLGFRLFGRAVKAWCRRHHPDVVHSITVAYPGDIYHSQAGVYAEIQTQAVASRAGTASARIKRLLLSLPGKQRTLLALERTALAPANSRHAPQFIISLSPMMTRQVIANYNVNPSNVVELANPDLKLPGNHAWDDGHAACERNKFRSQHGLAETDRVALFVGHDFRRKGLRFAIKAIAQTQNWKLLVVGHGKDHEYVDLAKRLNLTGSSHPPRVIFIGPTRDVDALYAASDALLFPTFYDSFGLVALEALSHGLPVISTEFLGASYLVKQCNAGTIVPSPLDVDLMAQALDSLPTPHSPEHLALTKRARQASTGLTPDQHLDKILQLYHQVLQQRVTDVPSRI